MKTIDLHDGWAIGAITHKIHNIYNIYHKHKVNKSVVYRGVYYTPINLVCWECHECVPDEVIGFLKLVRWDK